MSGIALVLHKRGYQVTGSDLKPSRYVTLLEKAGVPVSIGHRAGNLDHPDVVVISSAIPAHNVELQEARRRGILVVKRAQALAWLMQSGRGIAVCGTHGKTTTTSMISRVLVDGGYDPTFLVGGELNDLGSNARHGEGEFVVCEADESDGSLLLLSPEVAVLTNMELDHHSHYLHVEDVERVFRRVHRPAAARRAVRLLRRRPPGGGAGRARWPAGRARTGSTARPTIRRGTWSPRHPGSSFEVWSGGRKLASVTLRVPGQAQRARTPWPASPRSPNWACAPEQIVPALERFTGAVRRFQLKGERDGVTVVDDYAHHPTELRATLRAAREGEWSRVIAVFQPHLYSRTEFLQAEFAEALLEADVAVVTDVYGAREDPLPGRERQAHRRQHPAAAEEQAGGLPAPAGLHRRLPRPGDGAGRPGAHPGRGRRPPGGRALPDPGLAPAATWTGMSALSGELRAVDGVRLWANAPLAPFTTIGTGGKAGLLVTVRDVPALVAACSRLLETLEADWFCLGAGSNLLVADRGYTGRGRQAGRELPVRRRAARAAPTPAIAGRWCSPWERRRTWPAWRPWWPRPGCRAWSSPAASPARWAAGWP